MQPDGSFVGSAAMEAAKSCFSHLYVKDPPPMCRRLPKPCRHIPSLSEKEILEYEAEGLARMAKAAPSLSIPRPWMTGSLRNGCGFIVMDCIKQGGGKHTVQYALGKGVHCP